MSNVNKPLLKYLYVISWYLLISSPSAFSEEIFHNKTYVGIGANSGTLNVEPKTSLRFYGAPTAKMGYFFIPNFSVEGEYSVAYHLNLSSDIQFTAGILNTISILAKAYYNLKYDGVKIYGIAGFTKANSDFILDDTISYDTLPKSGHFSCGAGFSYGNQGSWISFEYISYLKGKGDFSFDTFFSRLSTDSLINDLKYSYGAYSILYMKKF